MPITRNTKLVSDSALRAYFENFESRSTVVDGGLSFQSFGGISYLREILPDAFNVKPPLKRSATISLFSRALHEARRAGPLTTQAIIEQAEQIYRTDRAVPLRNFTLWTKVRARQDDQSPGFRLKWGDVSIRSATQLPKQLQINEFHNATLGDVDPIEPKSSLYIIMNCKDRRKDDAVHRMLDALQLVMGLINLYESRGQWTIFSGRHWRAGKLWLGPYQFVFQGRSLFEKNGFWYNPDYDGEDWDHQLPAITDYIKVIPRVRLALSALTSHPLKSILVGALQLMQEAFETRDGNYRLLRFWAALEKLYVEDSRRERSNEKVIERATFADSDYLLTEWQLSHISRVRNEYVHARGHGDDLLQLGQTLRDLLTRHLLHWIFHGANFKNHKSLLAFVDLPREDGDLLAMRNAIDRRLKLNEE